MPMRNLVLLLLLSLPLVALSGCSGDSDSQSYHVKGTVTYKGKPLPAGTIQFVPAEGNSGPPGLAKIVDGKFDTSAKGGTGTVGGKHTVIINGFDGQAQPDAELPQGQPLFNEFKVDFDVPKQDDPVSKDFKVVPNQP